MTQAKGRKLIAPNERGRHSLSFYLLVVFAVGMLLRFYFSVFFPAENALSKNFSPILSMAICVTEIILIGIRDIRISYNALALFLFTAVCIAVSVFLNASGVEHAVGLLSILIGIYSFHADPLRKREHNGMFLLFIVTIVLILLNGVPGTYDKELSTKFNPNNCAFLLAMLYCVCVTRICRRRSWLDFALAAVCFLLQFFYISRTALFCEVVFTLCSLMYRAWQNNSFNGRSVFRVILCFSALGILLAYFYSEVLYPAVGHGRFIIFGKDLFTGRQSIWHFAFESMRENFWFGTGGRLNETQFEAGYPDWIMNAHNQAVGTLAYYGIFAFVLFYISFASLAAQPYRKRYAVRTNRLPAVFLLAVTVMGYFEICFLSAYIWIAILFAYGLIFSNSVSEGNK